MAAIMAADSTALRAFTEVPTFTVRQQGTPAGSVVSITAEIPEASLRAVIRALAAAASMEAATVVVGGTR
jgi:hypothetical protein